MAEVLSSQELVSISEIRQGTVVLKTGGLRRVLLAAGVNFELKSQAEQEVLVTGFQEFLTSLDFAIQIIVHSRKINIDDYLKEIETLSEKETNELLKLQSQEYITFVRSFLDLYRVMEKKFFVVVPYDPVEISARAVRGGLSKILKRQAPTFAPEILSEDDFRRYQNQLLTREEQVVAGLARLGIKTIPLGTEELIEVYHSLYNPKEREKKTLATPYAAPEIS